MLRKKVKILQSQRIHNAREHNSLLIKFNKQLRNGNSCPGQARQQHATHWQSVAISGVPADIVLLLLLLLLLLTEIECSFGGSSLSTSTDKTSKNKYT
jgi:hypothetical protein